MPRPDLKLLASALICSLLWGSAFPAIKTVYLHWEARGINAGLSTLWLFAGVRFILAGLLLLPLARHPVRDLRLTPWKTLLGFGLAQTFFQYLFFYLGLAVAGASLAALLNATGSFWWVLLAPLILKTGRLTGRQWTILTVGAIGITLAVYAPGAGAGNPWLGTLFLTLASLAGALAVIQFQFVRRTMGARAATGWSLLMGGIGLFLAGCPALAQMPEIFDARVALLTVYLAFVSAAAFSLWNHLTTLYPVHLLATYRFFIPLCGVLESFLVLRQERPGWGFIVGGILVLAAMAAGQRSAVVEKQRPISIP